MILVVIWEVDVSLCFHISSRSIPPRDILLRLTEEDESIECHGQNITVKQESNTAIQGWLGIHWIDWHEDCRHRDGLQLLKLGSNSNSSGESRLLIWTSDTLKIDCKSDSAVSRCQCQFELGTGCDHSHKLPKWKPGSSREVSSGNEGTWNYHCALSRACDDGCNRQKPALDRSG